MNFENLPQGSGSTPKIFAIDTCKDDALRPFADNSKKLRIQAMLVLSRKKNESIVINNDITVVVVEIRGDKVRLGVEAPKDVPVHRREVYDAIHRNNAENSGVVEKEPGQTESEAGKAPEAGKADCS
jgi:carbon storage regulator